MQDMNARVAALAVVMWLGCGTDDGEPVVTTAGGVPRRGEPVQPIQGIEPEGPAPSSWGSDAGAAPDASISDPVETYDSGEPAPSEPDAGEPPPVEVDAGEPDAGLPVDDCEADNESRNLDLCVMAPPPDRPEGVDLVVYCACRVIAANPQCADDIQASFPGRATPESCEALP